MQSARGGGGAYFRETSVPNFPNKRGLSYSKHSYLVMYYLEPNKRGVPLIRQFGVSILCKYRISEIVSLWYYYFNPSLPVWYYFSMWLDRNFDFNPPLYSLIQFPRVILFLKIWYVQNFLPSKRCSPSYAKKPIHRIFTRWWLDFYILTEYRCSDTTYYCHSKINLFYVLSIHCSKWIKLQFIFPKWWNHNITCTHKCLKMKYQYRNYWLIFCAGTGTVTDFRLLVLFHRNE